jgi:lambda repressor-like predicted transcriptional regulator
MDSSNFIHMLDHLCAEGFVRPHFPGGAPSDDCVSPPHVSLTFRGKLKCDEVRRDRKSRPDSGAEQEVPASSKVAQRREVKALMDKQGWSKFKLATEANVDPKTVRKYLDGETKKLRSSTRKAIAEALGVDVPKIPE